MKKMKMEKLKKPIHNDNPAIQVTINNIQMSVPSQLSPFNQQPPF